MASRVVPRLRVSQYWFALFGLILLWPAAVNGGPFFFPDTSAYIRAVDAALLRTTGHRTAWSNDDVLRVAGAAEPKAERNTVPARPVEPKPVLLGRSIFYGTLAFTGVLGHSFWITIALQAAIAGAVILGVARHVIQPTGERLAWTVAIWTLALATTPLAWFTSMLMPDFLTGLAVVSGAMLVSGWQRETRGGRIFWFSIATFAALAHSSHVLVLLALATFVIGMAKLPGWRPGAMALAAVALLGLVGEAAFAAAVTRMTATAPIRPPFLTARLVEDGPGTAYLQRHCGHTAFLICRYRDRLPMASDTFLWGEQGSTGVFKTLSAANQRALAAEQGAFVRAVILDQPTAVIVSTAHAVVRQFQAWRLSEFSYPSSESDSLIDHIPTQERSILMNTRAFQRTMPTTLASLMIIPWSLAGLAAIWFARKRRNAGLFWFGGLSAVGWIVNVALCGALSTPHDRYQARVIWVLALAALATFRPTARQFTVLLQQRRSHAPFR